MCPGCGVFVTIQTSQSMRNHHRQCLGDGVGLEEVLTDSENDDVHDDDYPMCSELLPHENDDYDGHAVPVVPGLDDFDHLTQFLETGRCLCTDGELQLVKFFVMAHGGYGCSRHFSEGMLEYSKQAGGRNVHLPDSWRGCVEQTTELIEKLEGKRKTFTLNVPIPQDVRNLLADPNQAHISFKFECPITELIRVAMFSETCQSWNNVALTYEDNGGHLDDFCNGDRYKRIASTLSPGGAILGAVLATDGICLDKCMFDSQEVRAGVPCA